MTIKRKFVLCGLLVFLALGAIASATGLAVRDAQHDQVRSNLETVANLETSRIDDLLTANAARITAQIGRAGLAAGLDRSDRTAASRASAAVMEGLAGDPTAAAATVLAPDQSIVADSTVTDGLSAPQPLSDESFHTATAAVELGEPFVVGPAFRVGQDDERYPITVPVLNDRNVAVGYVVVEFRLGPVQSLFEQGDQLGETGEAHLVQQTATGAQFISQLRFEADVAFSLVVPRSQASVPAILAAFGPSATYDGLTDYRGQEVIASVRRLPHTPWALVVKIDRSEAYAPFNQALALGFIGFTAAAVLSLGALWLASQSVLRRIRRVADSAAAISAGDLTARVGDLSHDELGTLARAFDQMADTLVSDMARRHRIEAELAHRARHDVLTGLPNRSAIQHELKSALSEADPGTVAVLFCDLDEFKTVNDDLGHSAGDALLREVTNRLRRAVSDRHVLARFGGDEFVVVARDLDHVNEAIAIAERMTEELSLPVSLGARDVFVTTSVGVALNTLGSTAETLIRDADAAMYQAKARGRARVVVHDAGIGARTNNRLAMTTELHLAIANGGLDVALQPICDLDTGATHALEVLVRWRHEGREIDPSEFVTRATELDLAGALDRWVLATSCRLMTELRGITVGERGWMHVNVTGTSLVDESFADDVLQVLRDHRVAPSELCLEIVEDRLGGAPQHALSTLDRLRATGVRVAIDDFGTGHSSLSRLRDLPADTVKIDQSFIRDLGADSTSLAITGAIINLAERLGLEVVAEGVEDEQGSAVLRSLGCRYGQGYFLAVPRRADQVVAEFAASRGPVVVATTAR